MKSTSTGRAMARHRSLMKSMAPLSTATSSGGSLDVVLGDLRTELGDPDRQAIGVDQHGPHVGCSPGRDARSGLVEGHRRDTTGAPRRLDPEPASRPAHPAAPRQLGPDRRARRDGQGAIHLGQRRRVLAAARLAQPPPQGAPRQRPVGLRHRPGVGGVGQHLGGQRVEQHDLGAQHAGLPGQQRDGIAAGHLARTAGAARGGPGCGRTRGRSLLSSHTGARPTAAHSAWVSLRRRASSGCRPPGSMPASPSAPAPRSRLIRIVSAWSSMVWPVATSGGSTAKRAARARASRLGPGATDTRWLSKRAPNQAAGAAHHLGLGGRAGPQAVVDVDRRDLTPGGGGQDEEGERVGAARDGTDQRRAGRREGAPAQQVGDESGGEG